jgi:tetratricopeptide (TPR) repeat protein
MQLYQQGKYPEALQQFELARQADPTNPDSYYNLASTYQRLGKAQNDAKMLEQAEVLYNQCLELSPNHKECYRALAVHLVETNRSDKAFTLMNNWIKGNPTLVDARVELSRLQSEFGQIKQAQQTLDDALAMDPNHASAWAYRGKLREDAGDTSQAIQNYQQSLALNAMQPDLYQRVAALNVQMAQKTINNANTAIIASGQGTATTAGTTSNPRY